MLVTIKDLSHYKLKFTSIPPMTSTFRSVNSGHEKPKIVNKGYFHLRCEGRHVTAFCFSVGGGIDNVSQGIYKNDSIPLRR